VEPDVYFAWSSRSRGLAEALLTREDRACPGCGQPTTEAWDPRSEGEWEHAQHECMACQELDRGRKAAKDKTAVYVTVSRAPS
jgi:hypothetical protein